MMKVCCLYECSNRSSKSKRISLHSFPTNELFRKKWSDVIGTDENMLPKHPRLCSEHFLPSNFKHFKRTKRRLRSNAVPSLKLSPGSLDATTSSSGIESINDNEMKTVENDVALVLLSLHCSSSLCSDYTLRNDESSGENTSESTSNENISQKYNLETSENESSHQNDNMEICSNDSTTYQNDSFETSGGESISHNANLEILAECYDENLKELVASTNSETSGNDSNYQNDSLKSSDGESIAQSTNLEISTQCDEENLNNLVASTNLESSANDNAYQNESLESSVGESIAQSINLEISTQCDEENLNNLVASTNFESSGNDNAYQNESLESSVGESVSQNDILGISTKCDEEKLKKLVTSASASTQTVPIIEFPKQCALLKSLNTGAELSGWTGVNTFDGFNSICAAVEEYMSQRMKTEDLYDMGLESRVFLTLVKLKTNLPFSTLATLFPVSDRTLKRYFVNMLHILSQVLRNVVSWPSKESINQNMPKCFENYPDCRVVLDCTEFFVSKPQCITCRTQMYSQYYQAHTLKVMVGVTPSGLISFLSDVYGGKASDNFIFTQSGIVNLMEENDAVMVDKGFRVDAVCNAKNIKIIRPPFRNHQLDQLPDVQCEDNKGIAAARVHIERINQRLKNFQILSDVISLDMIPLIDDILYVISGLVNLSAPILADERF